MTNSANKAIDIIDWCLAVLPILTSLLPLAISLAALAVAYQQLSTNKLKIRLDLYNRRFDIYEKTIEYYQSYHYGEKQNRDACAMEFIRRYREALFLFGKDSDVYKLLSELKAALSAGINYHEKRESEPDNIESHRALAEIMSKNRMPDIVIEDLEKALLPWLDFKSIEKNRNIRD